ncbi:alpha/beta hydrolase [Maricaulaceae bacterium EIL42A08]|nr:alpha/beta hydrolase [Maricaulaceae bacterium EIL42A08]
MADRLSSVMLRPKLSQATHKGKAVMEFQAETLSSPSGASLAWRRLAAQGEARATVQIHHGLSEHAARYERFARHLAGRGFNVVAHDHRGHGATTADDAPAGVFASSKGWAAVIDDAQAVETAARQHFGTLPHIVFGHSMGGVIAMNHAQERKGEIAGLAVWNANLALGSRANLMRTVLGIEGLFKKATAPSTWMDALAFKAWGKQVKDARTDFDWLSRIPDEVDAYINDPLCGAPASISLWRDFIELVERGSDENRTRMMRLDLPIHMAAGGEDPATDKGEAMDTLKARLYNARFIDATMRFDPKGRHETLNDEGYEQAMDDFANWAERVAAQAG